MQVALYFFAALAIICFISAVAFAILAFQAKDSPGGRYDETGDAGGREARWRAD
jgi:hypothetical protein